MDTYDFSTFIEDFETDLCEYAPKACVGFVPFKGTGRRFIVKLESGETVEVVARLLDPEGD